MARRKPIEPPAVADGVPILPRHLVERDGLSAEEFKHQCREQRAWYRAHGIRASWAAYGIPDARERARLHHGGDPRDVLRPDDMYPDTKGTP